MVLFYLSGQERVQRHQSVAGLVEEYFHHVRFNVWTPRRDENKLIAK